MNDDVSRETLTAQVNIGLNAQKLLKDELLSSIFFSKKNYACQSFMETSANDDKARRELWQQVQGVIAIETELQQLIESGNLAKEQLDVIGNEQPNASIHNFFEANE